MLEAGLGVGETVLLEPANLNMNSCKLIAYGKGVEDRVVWINENLRDLIGKWLKCLPESKWLFSTMTGAKLETAYLRRTAKIRQKKLESMNTETISPHDFYHTFAIDYIAKFRKPDQYKRLSGILICLLP